MSFKFKGTLILVFVLVLSLLVSSIVIADDSKASVIIIIPNASYFFHVPGKFFKMDLGQGSFWLKLEDGTIVQYYGSYTYVFAYSNESFEAYKIKFGIDKFTEIN